MKNLSEEEIAALQKLMASAAPEVRSARMWQAIQEGLDKPPVPEARPSFWQRFWQPWFGPRLVTVMGGLLAVGLVMMLTPARKPTAPQAKIQAPAEDKGFALESPVMPPPSLQSERAESAKKEQAAEGNFAAEAPAPQAPMASKAVAKRPSAPEPAPAMAPSRPEALEERGDLSTPMILGEQAGLGASRAPQRKYRSPAPSAFAPASPTRLPQAEGEAQGNGAWDWQYLQFAFNNRLWPKVASELVKAREQAGRPAERAFAASALHLLSQPGQPLGNFGLEGTESPGSEQLMVLSAGTWKLNAESGLVYFSGKVTVRQGGLRSEMSKLILDFNQGRAIYGDVPHFIRLAGEEARVVDAQGLAVTANEFSASDGAVYQFDDQTLKMK